MNTELQTYKEKPSHISFLATDAFNMRITPDRKEKIKNTAIEAGVSMAVVALSAFDSFFASKQPATKIDWLNW